VRYWRVPEGPEVDWVIEHEGRFVAVEVKWTDRPRPGDARHLEKFLSEYASAVAGFIVCQTPRPLEITERVMAVPWQSLRARGGALLEALG
jgi:predicted AAA+ superfamily ATPase